MRKLLASVAISVLVTSASAQTLQNVTDNGSSTSTRINVGNIYISPGNADHTGYLEFYKGGVPYNPSARIGYIGFNNSNIEFTAEQGSHLFKGDILVNDKIGIGTAASSARLQLSNSFDQTVTSGIKSFFEGSWNTPDYATNFRFLDLSSTEGGKILQVNGYGIGIGTDPPEYGSADQLYVSGNVGIGTSRPREKLSVNGTVRAKEVKVEAAPWPDFVFDRDYSLRSLSEVEEYIKVNKHLPEVPSATQVEKEGLALGEINAKLLQKVEELTLYLIEENKKNSSDRLLIKQLTKRIAALESQSKMRQDK